MFCLENACGIYGDFTLTFTCLSTVNVAACKHILCSKAFLPKEIDVHNFHNNNIVELCAAILLGCLKGTTLHLRFKL